MKKWTYLAVAGMLLGSAPVFTGCVDTDEPWGVEQLRGAKAELLKAKALVEEANAAYRQAETQWMQAYAKQQEALALQAEYQAEIKRLEAELAAANNEKEMARLEQEKQYYEHLMEQQQVAHEEAMANAEANKALAERNLEIILKQIEIAQQVGSDDLSLSLTQLRVRVQNQYATLYGGMKYSEDTGLATGTEVTIEQSLYGKLLAAQEEVYNATLNADKGIITGEGYIPKLELTVAEETAKVEAQEEAIAQLQNFLEKDVETTDWRGEISKMEDALDELEKSINQGYIDLKKAQNSDAYLALKQALYGVFPNGTDPIFTPDGELSNWDAAVGDGAYQVWKKAEKKLNELKEETKFTLEAQKMEAPVSDVLNTLLQDVEASLDPSEVPSSVTTPTDWKNLEVTETEYDYWDAANKEGIELDTEKGVYSDEIQSIVENYKYWNDVLQEATQNDYENAIGVAKINLAKANRELESIQEDLYEPAEDNWEIALKAAQGTATAVPTTKLQEGITAYNNAYKALGDAIKAYNDAYDAAYESAENEVKDDIKLVSGLDATALATLNGFNLSKARTDWAGVTVDGPLYTITNFEAIVKANSAAGGQLTADQVYARALQIIDEYVTDELEGGNYDSQIQAAVASDEDLQDAQETLDETVGDTNEAYNKLDDAIAAYKTLVAYPYGQALTTAANELLSKEDLVGIIPAGSTVPSVNTNWYTEEKVQNVATGHYVIANTDITAAEVTNATKTQLDADVADGAWRKASKALFGVEEAATVLGKEEVYEAAVTDPNVANSPAYQLYQKQDEIQGYQDAIDQVTDLGVLAAEVKAGYEALLADMQTEYDEAFAEAEEAITTAEEAKDKALADLEAEDAKNNDLKADIAELEAKYKAQSEVKAQLIQAVNNILDLKDANDNDINFAGTDDFEEELQEAIEGLQSYLVTLQRNLAEAEIALQKAKDGQYDALSDAKLKLTIATNDFNYANEQYMKLNEVLQSLLEDASDSTPEEQPAE